MSENSPKSFIERLFGKKSTLPTPTTNEPEVRSREPNSEELGLGYANGYDEETKKEVWQYKGISQADRSTHFYIVGGSGTGKTKFLTSLVVQDIRNGFGFGVIDPHGDLIEDIKRHLVCNLSETELMEKVVVIDPTLKRKTATFNPLEKIEGISPEWQAERLIDAFRKIWFESWGNRMENILRQSLVALCENNLTLTELPRFLTDEEFRHRVMENVENLTSREYFSEQYDKLKPQTRHEWAEPILNRINAFLLDKHIRHIFASEKSSFDPREVMDNKKILLVKLDRGRLGGAGDLLGALLVSKIQTAAFSRSDIPDEERVPFYLYIDEFQNFATQSFLDTLTQARKYRLSLILAHQNLAQLPRELRASALGNCTIQAYFRISRDDASVLSKESMVPIYRQPPGWEQYTQILQELPPRWCYIKNKNSGGVVRIFTESMPAPHEYYGVDKDFIEEKLERGILGFDYLRDREAIEAEHKVRRQELGITTGEKEDWESFAEPK